MEFVNEPLNLCVRKRCEAAGQLTLAPTQPSPATFPPHPSISAPLPVPRSRAKFPPASGHSDPDLLKSLQNLQNLQNLQTLQGQTPLGPLWTEEKSSVRNLVLQHQQLQQFEQYFMLQQHAQQAQQLQQDSAKTHLDKYLKLTNRYLDTMSPFLQCFSPGFLAGGSQNVQAAAQAAASLLLSPDGEKTRESSEDSVKYFLNKLIEHNFLQQLQQQQQLNDLLNNNNSNNGEVKEAVVEEEELTEDYYEKHVQLLNFFKNTAGVQSVGQMAYGKGQTGQATGKGQYKRLIERKLRFEGLT